MLGDKRGDITVTWGAFPVDYAARIDLVLRKHVTGVSTAYAKPFVIEFEEREASRFASEPTMALPMEEAKQLMQALWDAGVRPEYGNASGAHVAALQAHIKFAESVVDKVYSIADTQKVVREMAERYQRGAG
jgi:hypothetical protein